MTQSWIHLSVNWLIHHFLNTLPAKPIYPYTSKEKYSHCLSTSGNRYAKQKSSIFQNNFLCKNGFQNKDYTWRKSEVKVLRLGSFCVRQSVLCIVRVSPNRPASSALISSNTLSNTHSLAFPKTFLFSSPAYLFS